MARFEIKQNSQGYSYVVLIADNGRMLFHTEAFETKRKDQSYRVAEETIATIKRNVFKAEIP